jgi:hypothetical protein
MILSIPENFTDNVNKLQKAHYEVMGRQNIINYMISNDMKNQPTYTEIWTEYLDCLAKYDAIKKEFTTICVSKIMSENNITITTQTWTIDFDKKELIISE